MAAELVTPTDEISGLPLPIAPQAGQLPLSKGHVADWHHHFHPRRHPSLQTEGGLALRHCRVQLVDINFHNHSDRQYHRFFKGPEIPDSEDEQFRLVVLACAGFLPKEGIDLTSGEPQRVRLTPHQIKLLREQKPLKDETTNKDLFGYRNLRYDYGNVRNFIVKYTLEQSLRDKGNSIVSEPTVEEFLQSQENDRRRFLGHLLLAKKAEVASEALLGNYRDIKRAGLLHPKMPDSPQTIVKHKLGNPAHREELFSKLAASLRLEYASS